MTTIPILRYHSVSTDPAPWIAPYAVAPATFARHVDLITASGRTAMTVSELCAALTGRTPLPHRPIVITFDDGFADFTYAARVLSEHYLPSTVYLTTGALRGRGPRPTNMAMPPAPMLDWSQLAELCELNVEIGAHSHTHRSIGHTATQRDRRRDPPIQGNAGGRPGARSAELCIPIRFPLREDAPSRPGAGLQLCLCGDERVQLQS